MIHHENLNIATVSAVSKPVRAGRYEGVYLYISGTYSSSVSEPNQRIKISLNGKQIVYARWQTLRKLCDIWAGMPDVTAGTAFHFGLKVPFYHPKLKTALSIRADDLLVIESEAIGTTVTTANLDVSMIPSDEPEAYQIYINELSETLTGALLNCKTGGIRNVSTLMVLDATTTNPNTALLTIDGVQQYHGSWNALKYFSNTEALKEASALDVLVFNLVKNGRIDEALCDDWNLNVDAGAGTLAYLVISHTFSNERTASSIALLQNEVQAKYNAVTADVPTVVSAPVSTGAGA